MLSSTDRSVSFYQNSSVWLDGLDFRSWDRNPVDSNAYIYIYIYIWSPGLLLNTLHIYTLSLSLSIYIYIGLMSRVFNNRPGDQGSIPRQVIPKTQKMVLDYALLNTQHYEVRGGKLYLSISDECGVTVYCHSGLDYYLFEYHLCIK